MTNSTEAEYNARYDALMNVTIANIALRAARGSDAVEAIEREALFWAMARSAETVAAAEAAEDETGARMSDEEYQTMELAAVRAAEVLKGGKYRELLSAATAALVGTEISASESGADRAYTFTAAMHASLTATNENA